MCRLFLSARSACGFLISVFSARQTQQLLPFFSLINEETLLSAAEIHPPR